jgi:hypothetical protein
MAEISNTNENYNCDNRVLVAVADMLQYSETNYIIECSCGKETWFILPQDGDENECDCGVTMIVCNSD